MALSRLVSSHLLRSSFFVPRSSLHLTSSPCNASSSSCWVSPTTSRSCARRYKNKLSCSRDINLLAALAGKGNGKTTKTKAQLTEENMCSSHSVLYNVDTVFLAIFPPLLAKDRPNSCSMLKGFGTHVPFRDVTSQALGNFHYARKRRQKSQVLNAFENENRRTPIMCIVLFKGSTLANRCEGENN